MTTRRPSPPICAGCLRQHVRLERDVRADRRQKLVDQHAYDDPIVRLYVEQLFDHLTIGVKVFAPTDPQRHKAPPIPRIWTAEELAATDRSVVRAAFGVS